MPTLHGGPVRRSGPWVKSGPKHLFTVRRVSPASASETAQLLYLTTKRHETSCRLGGQVRARLLQAVSPCYRYGVGGVSGVLSPTPDCTEGRSQDEYGV